MDFEKIKQTMKLSTRSVVLLLCAIPFNALVYYGARAMAKALPHYSLAIGADYRIPFISSTIWIYWGCSLFWVVNYVLGTVFDKAGKDRFITAHYLGESICFVFFLILPTTMDRAVIVGDSLSDRIVALTYLTDCPNNLFPSIHCFASWLCWIGVRNNNRISRWYQAVSFVFAVLVCISTLTVKQHVLADVPAGIAVAEISYALAALPDRLFQKQTIQSTI